VPTRAEILVTLAMSQAQVVAYFQGLSQLDLERPVTASGVPGAAPWRARDHLAHLVQSERNIKYLLGRALAGDPRDEILRWQYPAGMPLPATLGNWDALTPEEQEQLELAVAGLNETYRNAHQDDSLEMLVADFLAARQDLLDLLQQFTDEQLTAPVPSVIGDAAASILFAGRAGHAAEHINSIEEGFRQSSVGDPPRS
jgi:flagellar motility protein MotE (MotC chaperone)